MNMPVPMRARLTMLVGLRRRATTATRLPLKIIAPVWANSTAPNQVTGTRRSLIIKGMMSTLTAPMPSMVSWNAPKTLKTDMRGPALLGYAIGTALSGSPPTRVLPVTPAGGTGLAISEADKQRAVQLFLRG